MRRPMRLAFVEKLLLLQAYGRECVEAIFGGQCRTRTCDLLLVRQAL